MTIEMIREIAKEFRYTEYTHENCNFITFSKGHYGGETKIMFYEQSQIIILIITKRKYKPFRRLFNDAYNYDQTYRIFKNANNFRYESN
jgi:hypothetical protein